MVKAFHRLGGRIRARVPFIKSIASIITIGTAGRLAAKAQSRRLGPALALFWRKSLGWATPSEGS